MVAATKKRAKAHLNNGKGGYGKLALDIPTAVKEQERSNVQKCPSPIVILIWKMYKYSGI